MAKLEQAFQKKVDNLIEIAKAENKNNNFDAAIRYLLEAWGTLPEPKYIYDDSYHLVKYICQVYLKANELNEAREWIIKIYDCDKERIDSGERELLHGRVEYLLGNLIKAKELFQISYMKSEGRYPDNPEFIKLMNKK